MLNPVENWSWKCVRCKSAASNCTRHVIHLRTILNSGYFLTIEICKVPNLRLWSKFQSLVSDTLVQGRSWSINLFYISFREVLPGDIGWTQKIPFFHLTPRDAFRMICNKEEGFDLANVIWCVSWLKEAPIYIYFINIMFSRIYSSPKSIRDWDFLFERW